MDLLKLTYPLATGPNRYKSNFGKVLEGVFRKNYFTLQTLVILGQQVQQDPEKLMIFAGSALDLSRRTLEDMIYMMYIHDRDKDKYSKQFLDYIPIEVKQDLIFLLDAGADISKKIVDKINSNYDKAPKKLKNRHNWSGQSFEEILQWFVDSKIIKNNEIGTILKIYNLGNRKNHTSPSDIMGHVYTDSLYGTSANDLDMAIMITFGSLNRIALLATDEIEVEEEIIKGIEDSWKSMNSGKLLNNTTIK